MMSVHSIRMYTCNLIHQQGQNAVSVNMTTCLCSINKLHLYYVY